MTAAWTSSNKRPGIILPDVVAAEPGPHLRDVAAALLHTSERGVEIPVGWPASGNVRSDISHSSERCVLISPGTRFLKSAVLHEGECSIGNKYVRGFLPANPRVDPVKSGRREHRPKLLAGKQCILKLSVHKLHRPRTFQVLPGQRDEVLARFELP